MRIEESNKLLLVKIELTHLFEGSTILLLGNSSTLNKIFSLNFENEINYRGPNIPSLFFRKFKMGSFSNF